MRFLQCLQKSCLSYQKCLNSYKKSVSSAYIQVMVRTTVIRVQNRISCKA